MPGLRFNKRWLILFSKLISLNHRAIFVQHGEGQLSFQNGQLRPGAHLRVVFFLKRGGQRLRIPLRQGFITDSGFASYTSESLYILIAFYRVAGSL